ncbi:TRAP transporter large permease [Chloroflexota bacterium]
MSLPDPVIGLLGFILILVLIFLKMPVAYAFVLAAFVGLVVLVGFETARNSLIVTVWYKVSSYLLICLPLFVLMGTFAFYSGIGPDLYESALKWWGRLPGGLALTTVWGCAAFGALTGASIAGMATFTPIAWKPMLDLGYDKRLAAGSIICSATMASMIPPSMPMILYAFITDEPISRLFIAGIFPGILEAVIYVVAILLVTRLGIQAGPAGPGCSWKEKIVSLKKVWGMLAIFLLVMGGIYLGVFTPTEAGAVGAAGTFTILVFRRGFNIKLITRAVEDALGTSAMLFLIVAGAVIFVHFIALSGFSLWLANGVAGIGMNKYLILIAALGVLLIGGCLMPGSALTLLFVPIFYPLFVGELGFNGIWYGVISICMGELATISPPVGMHLFVFKGLVKGEIGTFEMWQGVLPFVIADFVRAALIIAFPIIALWLPNTMF